MKNFRKLSRSHRSSSEKDCRSSPCSLKPAKFSVMRYRIKCLVIFDLDYSTDENSIWLGANFSWKNSCKIKSAEPRSMSRYMSSFVSFFSVLFRLAERL